MERAPALLPGDRASRRSSGVKQQSERLGNQLHEERDAPEQPDEDEDGNGDGDGSEERDVVRRFSVSSESSALSPLKESVSPEVVQPSDEEKQSDEAADNSSVEEDAELQMGEVGEPQGDPTAEETIPLPVYVDLQQQQQLQDDIEVLASHLQIQTRELETERSLNQTLQSQLQHLKQTMEREMESILIENDALQRQNALLVSERDESLRRAQTASETHEELLSALRQQQQREEHARTIVTALVKERDALKKQLDESKTYCRRLEDEAVALRAEQQHMKSENKSLQTAIKATKTQKNDRELAVISAQEQQIQSLRADLLQMEFELKTLSVDKEKLNHRVATLQRQSESRSTSYDVISLKGEGDSKTTIKKRLSVLTGSSSSSSSSNRKSKRLSDAEVGDGFSNLMTLPNCVDDDPHASDARTASLGSGTLPPRPRTPMGSLVSKTFSSARKKLFQSSTSHAGTVVLPQ